MNSIKSVIGMVVLVLLYFTSVVTNAQTPVTPVAIGGGGSGGPVSEVAVNNEFTPIPISAIVSQDTLREQVLASVTHGSRSVDAVSMDWNFKDRLTYMENVRGVGAEDVLTKLLDIEFKYRLTNPEDPISGYIQLYTDGNKLLFRGFARYNAAQLSKGESPQYNIWMQEIPILSNVESAELLTLPVGGGPTVHRRPLQVNNGHVIFDPGMAGAPNGILSVKFVNGSTMTYHLSDPVAQAPNLVGEKEGAWKLEGHYVYETGEKSVFVKIIETWVRPTVLLKIGTGANVTFDVVGLFWANKGNGMTSERPSALVLTSEDGKVSQTLALSKDGNSTVGFGKGNWRIRFIWENFGKPNTLYDGPMDDGHGKG